jgi:hypothetical protein
MRNRHPPSPPVSAFCRSAGIHSRTLKISVLLTASSTYSQIPHSMDLFFSARPLRYERYWGAGFGLPSFFYFVCAAIEASALQGLGSFVRPRAPSLLGSFFQPPNRPAVADHRRFVFSTVEIGSLGRLSRVTGRPGIFASKIVFWRRRSARLLVFCFCFRFWFWFWFSSCFAFRPRPTKASGRGICEN